MVDKNEGVQVYLLLGGNENETPNLFTTAGLLLDSFGLEVTRKSGLYTSPSWGYISKKPYFNQALEVFTLHEPAELLKIVLMVEEQLGRIRSSAGSYADRPIDIDILLYASLCYNTDELVIPHPRLWQRKFALYPLAELAASYVHPGLGKTIEELAASCPDSSEDVKKYD